MKATRTPARTPRRDGSGKGTPFSARRKTPSCDRFIPSRSAMNKDLQMHQIHSFGSENSSPGSLNVDEDEYKQQLTMSMFDAKETSKSKILSFSKPAPRPKKSHSADEQLQALYTQNKSSNVQVQKMRHIASTPERILDAPDLLDDYYLNLLDWSTQNLLAVGLGHRVYIWNAANGEISLLTESASVENDITSLSWLSSGNILAVGNADKEVQIWDVSQQRQVRSMVSHYSRISSLSWNQHILSSGSRDSQIHNHDVRVAQHHSSSFLFHEQEVCGLQWSPDGSQLASGGNDNVCCVWENGSAAPKHVFSDHNAAVKAIAWSPHQRNLLATGGGTADRHIRFWNTSTGACVNDIDTKSQVCSIVWNPFENELLSSHGFSQNQLTIWKYPSLTPITELSGHTSRVLHTALSADGTTVCSAAADETLRFWKVFEPVAKKTKKKSQSSSLKRMNLR